jgi:acetyl esterase/lipase
MAQASRHHPTSSLCATSNILAYSDPIVVHFTKTSITMALDFSQYGGPSEEWLAVEKTLPALAFDTSIDPLTLQKAVNEDRESRFAPMFLALKDHVETKNYSIPTRDGSTIEARTYRSVDKTNAEKLPVYLYFHGGGFIFGTLDSENAVCANTAIKTGVIVLNVNYRHTPQHIFPTPWLDAEDALAWLHKNIEEVGGDASKVVVGGISAGGTLAAALALEQHLGKSEVTKSLPILAGSILIIPCVSSPKTYDQGPGKKLKVSSYVENEFAPMLPKKTAEFFMSLLENGTPDLKDTKVNMVNASEEEVKGLAPTVFGIAGLDPLRDEALLYAKLLSEANVPTDIRLFKGVPHGHRRFGDALKASKHWDDCIEEGIAWVLTKPKATGKFDVKLP